MNLITEVDHEVDAQWGAAHSRCEKRTGVFLSSFFSPAAPFVLHLSSTMSTVNFVKLTQGNQNMSAG